MSGNGAGSAWLDATLNALSGSAGDGTSGDAIKLWTGAGIGSGVTVSTADGAISGACAIFVGATGASGVSIRLFIGASSDAARSAEVFLGVMGDVTTFLFFTAGSFAATSGENSGAGRSRRAVGASKTVGFGFSGGVERLGFFGGWSGLAVRGFLALVAGAIGVLWL